jgi:N6-adenosine-specific RNA methylase IME4
LRAERRAGEFLASEIPHQGGRPEKPFHDERVNNDVKLEDLGISYPQSSRWQSIASIPEEKFEQFIEEKRQDGKELTQTGLLQLAARQHSPEPTETPPLPERCYRCIVIDPPWPMKKIEREERPNQGVELDYPVMSLEEIETLPIPDLADLNGCHLYLWVTQKYLPAGLRMVEKWGFKYQCLMTWRKNVGITPYSWMYDTEHVIFARLGNLPLGRLGLRLSFDAPVQGHSVKPEIFYNERVIPASPGPRLEMFARKQRDGFDVWGNEVNSRLESGLQVATKIYS